MSKLPHILLSVEVGPRIFFFMLRWRDVMAQEDMASLKIR